MNFDQTIANMANNIRYMKPENILVFIAREPSYRNPDIYRYLLWDTYMVINTDPHPLMEYLNRRQLIIQNEFKDLSLLCRLFVDPRSIWIYKIELKNGNKNCTYFYLNLDRDKIPGRLLAKKTSLAPISLNLIYPPFFICTEGNYCICDVFYYMIDNFLTRETLSKMFDLIEFGY